MKKLASHYYRVTVLTTFEDEIFTTRKEADEWIKKVRHTFQQPEMACEIREISEWIL